MPTEPDPAEPAPLPNLPCWQGTCFRAQTKDAPEATPPKSKASLSVLPGILVTLWGLVTLSGAALFAAASLLTGHGRLIASLLWVHLPYIALFRKFRQLSRQAREGHRRNPDLPPVDVMGPLGFFAMSKASVRSGGVSIGEDNLTEWYRFTRAEFIEEASDYFVIRLHKKVELLRPLMAEMTQHIRSVKEAQKARRANRFRLGRKEAREDIAMLLAFITPPAATIYLAAEAFLTHGWRVDTIAAVCLAAFYTGLILFYPIARFGTRKVLTEVDSIKESRTLDLLFDARQVTAQEAMARLENGINGATPNASE